MNLLVLRDARGFVSLLTTIIISLLLLAITTSMVGIETLQLRKTIDAEQSLRAYYTAEAGVEDAVRRVLRGDIVSDTDCAPYANTGYDAAGSAGWTCQQVTFAGSPTGKLQTPDQAVTIDPGTPTSPYGSVLVEWEQGTNPSTYYNFPATFPTQNAYNATPKAPPIEMTIVRYPPGLVNASQVCTSSTAVGCSIFTQNAVVVPSSAGGGGINYSSPSFSTGSPYPGNCAANRSTIPPYYAFTSYRCFALLTNMPSTPNYLFRIRSRYAATSYRFTFFSGSNGNGNKVAVPDGMATIDVTAKAGSSYRRTITKLPLGKGANPGLNYVLYSDTDICKNFQVINNARTTGCP